MIDPKVDSITDQWGGEGHGAKAPGTDVWKAVEAGLNAEGEGE